MQTSSKRCIPAALIFMIGAWVTASCEAQTRAVLQGAPEAAADAMWKAVSKTCSVPGGLSTTFQRYFGPGVVEYRDVRRSIYPWALTKADELNGVKFKALAVLQPMAYRTYTPREGPWSSWHAPKTVRTAFTTEDAFRGKQNDAYEWPDWTLVLMEKHDNGWVYSLTQIPMKNGLWTNDLSIMKPFDEAQKIGELTVSRPIELDDFSRKAPTQSCAVLISKDPKGPDEIPKPDPKPAAPEVILSDWITLTDSTLFVAITESEFQRAAMSDSDGELHRHASFLDPNDSVARIVSPPTRYRKQMMNGRPLVIDGQGPYPYSPHIRAFVVRLEDGRPGLLPESAR